MLTATVPLRIIQITDLHLKTKPSQLWGVDVDASLNAVLAHIQGRNPAPDFIIATGDLVGDEPEAYGRLRELLEPWPFARALGTVRGASLLSAGQSRFSRCHGAGFT